MKKKKSPRPDRAGLSPIERTNRAPFPMEPSSRTETHASVAAGMGITSHVLETLVPLTCKTEEEGRNYATLRELLSAADKLGVHFWSLDRTNVKDIDTAFRQGAIGRHPDKGARLLMDPIVASPCAPRVAQLPLPLSAQSTTG